MVLYGTQILLFGGRSNEVKRQHVPMTYEIEDVDGVLEFVSYDKSSVLAGVCTEVNGTMECDNDVDVGLYFNDVWSYELDCERYGDEPCVDRTWEVLDVGARRGGCQMVLGREVCTHPAERWLHGAAMFDDSTMLVYGGFAQRCEDYCDDLWSFDARDDSWMEIYEIGYFAARTSPGKRWKFSLVADGEQFFLFGGFRLWHGFAADNSEANRWASYDMVPEGGYLQDFWVYKKRLLAADEPVPTASADMGVWSNITAKRTCYSQPGESWEERFEVACEVIWPGARAGHVAALDEAQAGMWLFGGYTTFFPYLSTGGRGSAFGVNSDPQVDGFTPYTDYPYYLDDLWFYNFTSGFWRLELPASASNPQARMDHTIILDGRILIMFGGFNGSHHFDDTWYYNTTSSRWLLKKTAVYPLWPEQCTADYEAIAEAVGGPEECFELERKRGVVIGAAKPVRPLCSDPGLTGCPGNDWYEPDDLNPELTKGKYRGAPYYGVGDRGAPWPKFPAGGQPIAPFAADAPRQFVWGAQWWDADWVSLHEARGDIGDYFLNATSIRLNESDPEETLVYEGTFYRRCTSVSAEPTRGTVLDGEAGRAAERVLLAQPRRRAPQWDGCRDECFGMTPRDLDAPSGGEIGCPTKLILEAEGGAGLLYYRPNQRSDHAVVYTAKLGQASQDMHRKLPGEMYIYGGVGFQTQLRQSVRETNVAYVLDDMWRLGVHDCERNCSMHGDCSYGFCRCYAGFWGSDCSNTSCPGDYCYFDEELNEQVCQHCCQAGYNHSDADHYETDVPKVPCTATSKQTNGLFGESNGICDGFGTCQCAPPFLLDDCSVKDCKHNCSGRGNCSVEFPVSRCVCNAGYYGEHCQHVMCLNNCSWPNGHCDHTTGQCTCEMMYSPYNNTRTFHPWEGEDCSFLWAYCAGGRSHPGSWAWVIGAIVAVVAFANHR